MRPLKNQLLLVAEAYRQAVGLSQPRVSTLIFNDGKLLDRLHADSDLTTGRYERALRWLSDNWPGDTDWPDGIARPASTLATASAESVGAAA